MTILDEIAEYKKIEVKENKQLKDISKLEKSKYFERNTLPLTDFLTNPGKSGIIAEYKKRSPSKGIINEKAKIEDVTVGYTNAGASGLSVLTDSRYFGGSNQDLTKARELNYLPILRKDFLIHEYQVIEAKSIGADVVLLIAAVLKIKQTKELARLANSLNMQVILEVHKIEELDFLNEFIDIVGVNNRDLKDFTVDINTSATLSKGIPGDFIKISESGIDSPEIIIKLKNYGFHGFLIGEKFMMDDNPATAFERFVKNL